MAGKEQISEVNPDLAKERATATFNVELMTNFLDLGQEMTARRRAIEREGIATKVSIKTIYNWNTK